MYPEPLFDKVVLYISGFSTTIHHTRGDCGALTGLRNKPVATGFVKDGTLYDINGKPERPHYTRRCRTCERKDRQAKIMP